MLLSNDFLKSDYAEKELARARAAGAVIVPVVIRSCKYEKLFGELQVILPGGKPVNRRERDAAWLDVTQHLDKVIAKVKEN
jgi:hypothetical protein